MKNDLISRFESIDLIMEVFKNTGDTNIKILCCGLVESIEALPSYGQGTLPLKKDQICAYCGAPKVDKK